jgi:hypothetical protein
MIEFFANTTTTVHTTSLDTQGIHHESALLSCLKIILTYNLSLFSFLGVFQVIFTLPLRCLNFIQLEY